MGSRQRLGEISITRYSAHSGILCGTEVIFRSTMSKVRSAPLVLPLLPHRFPLALVKFDTATGEPARDANRLLHPCLADEVGEAIGRIGKDAENAGSEFEGYSDPEQSERISCAKCSGAATPGTAPAI